MSEKETSQKKGQLSFNPKTTALVIQECQEGVIGKQSGLPELAQAAQKILPNISKLAEKCREQGITVFHCLAARRRDGKGSNQNAKLFRYMAKVENPLWPDTDAVKIVEEISVKPEDIIITRYHGLSPFQGTELDAMLRNLKIDTIVGVGVSLNIAITNLSFDAVNNGYEMIIPTDAVAGTSKEYDQQILQNTLGLIVTQTTSERLVNYLN